jgi:hypothetical protein
VIPAEPVQRAAMGEVDACHNSSMGEGARPR